jgi:hypothetical protein
LEALSVVVAAAVLGWLVGWLVVKGVGLQNAKKKKARAKYVMCRASTSRLVFRNLPNNNS